MRVRQRSTAIAVTLLVGLGALVCLSAQMDLDVTQYVNGVGVARGSIFAPVSVEANTATKVPVASESGELYTNTGDTNGSALTLLDDPPAGTEYLVALTTNQTVTITAGAGETLKYGTATCGTSLASSTAGSCVTLAAVIGGSGGTWNTLSSIGGWTCTP